MLFRSIEISGLIESLLGLSSVGIYFSRFAIFQPKRFRREDRLQLRMYIASCETSLLPLLAVTDQEFHIRFDNKSLCSFAQ